MALGILVRSSWWLNGQLPMQRVQMYADSGQTDRIFCAVSSVCSSLIFFSVNTNAFCECFKFIRMLIAIMIMTESHHHHHHHPSLFEQA